MKINQKVAITGGTYHKTPPTGKVKGFGVLEVAGELQQVCLVELDFIPVTQDGNMYITHLTVGEINLTPID